MACNCANSEQIDLLYKRYGYKTDKNKLSTREKVRYYFNYAMAAIALIVLFPVILLYVLYKGICDDDHKISMKKFFNIKQNISLNGQQ